MTDRQANGKSAALKSRSQIHDAEHLHAIWRDGVFFSNYANLPEAQSFPTTSICGIGLCVAGRTGRRRAPHLFPP